MSFLRSTIFSVTFAFAFISLQPSTVSSNNTPAPGNATNDLPPKALDICKETKTNVCPVGCGEKEPVCDSYAKTAGGKDPKCDADNGCSFTLSIKGDDKLVYVSHKKKIESAMTDSHTYKNCENGLIIYSLYAPS